MLKTTCYCTPIRRHKVDNSVNILVIEYLIQFPLMHGGPPKLNIDMWIFCSDSSISGFVEFIRVLNSNSLKEVKEKVF